jgi:hypothetical protein
MHKRITGGTLLSAFEPDRACLVERRTGSRLARRGSYRIALPLSGLVPDRAWAKSTDVTVCQWMSQCVTGLVNGKF